MIWLAIGCGGAMGALARHAMNSTVHARYGADPFPVGVLMVNTLGCLAAGVFAGLVATARWHPPLEVRAFILVGLLGGFTTFSAFGLDTLTLVTSGHHLKAALNVVSQLGLGLLAVWAGFAVVSAL
ncbi:MAG: fluoride efflux transporter CrcB [Acidobacteriota bacterium]